MARSGGEEFMIWLMNTHRRGAIAIAERIQHAIQPLVMPHAASPTAPVINLELRYCFGLDAD